MNDPGTLAITKAWLEDQITKLEEQIAFHNGRVQFLAAQHESHTQRLNSITGVVPVLPSEELPEEYTPPVCDCGQEYGHDGICPYNQFDYSNPLLDDCYQYGCDMDGNTPPAMD